MEKMKVILKEEIDLSLVLYSLVKLWKEVAIFMTIIEVKMQMLWKVKSLTNGLMALAIHTPSFKQQEEVNTGTDIAKTLRMINLTSASSTGQKMDTIMTTANTKSLQTLNYSVKTKET